MRRRSIFNASCLPSLLIFATGVTLWTRSYFIHDELWRRAYDTRGQGYQWVINSNRGQLAFERTHDHEQVLRPAHPESPWTHDRPPLKSTLQWLPGFADQRFEILGIEWASIHYVTLGIPVTIRHLVLPLWLSLLFALPPILWLRRNIKFRVAGFPVQPSTGNQELTTEHTACGEPVEPSYTEQEEEEETIHRFRRFHRLKDQIQAPLLNLCHLCNL